MIEIAEEIRKQLILTQGIRDNGGVDVQARNKNDHEGDVRFSTLYIGGRIGEIIASSDLVTQASIAFSSRIIAGCCCNASEPLHFLSLIKYEGILIGIRDDKGKITILGSLKANKEATGLGEKNTLITWVNTSQLPAGTICSFLDASKILQPAINKVTKNRPEKLWPAVVLLEDAQRIFPLRLAYPLVPQIDKAAALYKLLLERRGELEMQKPVGSFFQLRGEKVTRIKTPDKWSI